MSASTIAPRATPRPRAARRDEAPVGRVSLPDAVNDRLFFAQVREDPRGELEALTPSDRDTVVVVSSAGCTALSLLAAGAGRVIAVDRNATQNHLLELKAAATALGAREATGFLGGCPSTSRLQAYRSLRSALTPQALLYWDARLQLIARGVIGAGVSERFIGIVVAALKLLVHPTRRIERLLACTTVAEQRTLFEREWNTRRWRALFAMLCNRLVFRGTYPSAFFTHLEHATFASHFRAVAEHAIAELPVRDNYFLRQMLTGQYSSGDDEVPPYLSTDGSTAVASHRDDLEVVDGSMTSYLRTCADGSIDCFALSNICEWLSIEEIDTLFQEVLRTAAPGARLVYRNFLGWTELPARCTRVIEDVALSGRLSRADRSVMQRRTVACRIAAAS